jgi:hypothetical protein
LIIKREEKRDGTRTALSTEEALRWCGAAAVARRLVVDRD